MSSTERSLSVTWPWKRIGSTSILLFGVLLPAVALVVELAARLSAQVYFDPLPTPWHALLVAFVAVANGGAWFVLTRERDDLLRWAALANGVAIGVAAFYSLMFLPVLPLATIGIVFYGIGILPWIPLWSLVTAFRLRAHLRRRAKERNVRVRSWVGVTLALASLFVMDIPTAITRIGVRMATSDSPTTREYGFGLLRTLGSERAMLRLCYVRTQSATDLVSFFVSLDDRLNTHEARAIYYRMTGRAFNSVPVPERLRPARRMFDRREVDFDQGGKDVGGRLRGLALTSSRLDGSAAADAALGYLEWTMVLSNASDTPREARAQIALPPGAVVSRVTLWINGEEREAAFAGRRETTAAYQAVVTRQRDPVLVTSAGPDRISMQLFPVPAYGEMKVRIGMTLPLQLTSLREGAMQMPYFHERNFDVRDDLRHAVWIESKAFETGKVRKDVDDKSLGGPETSIKVRRGDENASWAADPQSPAHLVRQVISADASSSVPARLVLVLDGSASMRDAAGDLARTLARIPANVDVKLVVAHDGLAGSPDARTLTPAAAAQWIEDYDYVGGHDNTAALVRGLDLAAEEPDSVLLWIHGPQPVLVAAEEALGQRLIRGTGVSRWYELQVVPGRNLITEKIETLASIHTLRNQDLETQVSMWRSGARPVSRVRERVVMPVSTLPPSQRASDHLVRLWANDEIARLIHDSPDHRKEAIDVAHRYQLVTPVSGAVVLESQQQYDAAGLAPVAEGTVPTIPEPEEWALIIIALLVLAYAYHERRGEIRRVAV